MMKKFIVIVNGLAESGKDTFVSLTRKELLDRYPDLFSEERHSSDKPKRLLELMGWKGEKTHETRELLKRLVDFGDSMNMTLRMAENFTSSFKDVLFLHIRDIKVINSIVNCTEITDKAKIFTVLVKRPNKTSPEEDLWDIQNMKYDITIDNSGSIDDLNKLAKDMVNILFGYIV